MKLTTPMAVCTAFLTLNAAPAFAETLSQPEMVMELFTSQGCSSCPPANEAVVKIAETYPDILTLSYGVTYWDYLGWRDTFGDPSFTARQRQYDSALDSGVYTPMLVKGGQRHNSRVRPSELRDVLVPRAISFVRHSGELCIEGKLDAGTKLALVDYKPGTQSVAVKRGENRGRNLTLANVVTDVNYREWTGDIICGLHPENGLAVLAHDADTVAIVGAARFEP